MWRKQNIRLHDMLFQENDSLWDASHQIGSHHPVMDYFPITAYPALLLVP